MPAAFSRFSRSENAKSFRRTQSPLAQHKAFGYPILAGTGTSRALVGRLERPCLPLVRLRRSLVSFGRGGSVPHFDAALAIIFESRIAGLRSLASGFRTDLSTEAAPACG